MAKNGQRLQAQHQLWICTPAAPGQLNACCHEKRRRHNVVNYGHPEELIPPARRGACSRTQYTDAVSLDIQPSWAPTPCTPGGLGGQNAEPTAGMLCKALPASRRISKRFWCGRISIPVLKLASTARSLGWQDAEAICGVGQHRQHLGRSVGREFARKQRALRRQHRPGAAKLVDARGLYMSKCDIK